MVEGISLEEELVSWASQRPAWQQNILHELATGADITKINFSKLAYDLVADKPMAAILALGDLPNTTSSDAPVRLVAIQNVTGVNRLAPDQVLDFPIEGLTVVFGNNGSGKSGYARILTQVVRSRRQAAIYSNVFENCVKPGAELIADISGTVLPTSWPAEQHDHWSRIGYFDGDCGHVYMNASTEISFRPLAFHLLEGLGKACEEMGKAIDDLISASDETALVRPEVICEGTKAWQLFGELTGDSTDAEIDAACHVPDTAKDDVTRLQKEVELLGASDPLKEKGRIENLAQKIGAVHKHILTMEKALSEAMESDLNEKWERAKTLREAAQVASEQAFGSERLSGIGGEVWRELWQAARKYSDEVAYPDREFPVADEGSLCVLCGQELSEIAHRRMLGLEEFIKEEIQRQASEADKAILASRAAIQDLPVADEGVNVHLQDLAVLEETKVLASVASAALHQCEVRRAFLLSLTEPLVVSSEVPGEAWTLDYDKDLLLGKEAQLLDSAGKLDPEKHREALRAAREKLAELESSMALKAVRDSVKKEIDRLKSKTKLEKLKKGCATRGISDKATSLQKTYVTDAVVDAFRKEAEGLRLKYVVVEDTGGQKGHVRQKPALVGAVQSVKIDEVLSEGEKTALGLAGFLTEVLFDDSKSAIIFDDPVTSLDHVRRPYVAERIVELATSRQVIVFTHDIALVMELYKAAEEWKIALHARSLETRGEEVGVWRPDHPWVAKDIGPRCNELATDLARMKKERSTWDSDHYEKEVSSWAERMRGLWEQILLKEIVHKIYDQGKLELHPRGFKILSSIGEKDIDELQASYGGCSKWIRGHEKNPAVGYVPPEPDELEKELKLVQEWHKRVKAYK